jgi:hypothetical protein
MRFYQGLLPAIIWDPKRGAPLVEFNKGVFETDDEDIIRRLHKDGYLVEDDVEVLRDGGQLEHGGFKRATPEEADKNLPSGRSPMDNPEIAGGEPHKRKKEKTSESEETESPKTVGLADEAPKRKRKTTSKKKSTKKTTSKKKSSKKKTSKKRTIKRREE